MTTDNNFNEFETPMTEKKKRPTWIWIAAGVGLMLVCCVVAAVAFGGALFAGVTETQEATQTIDRFMQYMEEEQYGQAYALFSSDARSQFPMDDVFAMGYGANRVLFENYESVKMVGFDISTDMATGTLAEVNGTISYTNGRTGTFEAELINEDGLWMLVNIFVNIDAEN